MIFVGLFILTITFACGSATNSCSNNGCYTQCFNSPPTIFDNLDRAYNNIVKFVNQIQYLGYKGTAYLLDGGVSGSLEDTVSYNFQLTLASIIAIVRHRGYQCHPFCPIKYFNYGAMYPHGQNVTCYDKCQASAFFQNGFSKKLFKQYFYPHQLTTWNSMGQHLAHHCFEKEHCASSSQDPLLLFFPGQYNFAQDLNYCRNDSNPHYECAVVETILPMSSNSWYKPDWSKFSKVFKIKLDLYYVTAANNMLKCMNEKCCSGNSGGGPVVDKYNVATLGANKQPKVEVKANTQEEIVKMVEQAPRPKYDWET